MESDDNHLAPDELVWNAIYIYPGWPKSCFYVEPGKIQKSVLVLMRTFETPNFGIRVWTQKTKYHTTFVP